MPDVRDALLTVDLPQPLTRLSGRAEFSGWALHPQEVDDPAWGEVAVFCVVILLQRGEELPRELGYARHNLPRPDVATAFGEERFRNVGWQFEWDSRAVADGDYRLWVEAHYTCGYRHVAVPVTIANDHQDSATVS
jgi:hypothetical protein